jgi:hypothetical protein
MDHHNDEAENADHASNMIAETTAQPCVSVPKHVVRTALRQAEQSADEINVKLRELEILRDELARKLGDTQNMIDQLTRERDRCTKHVRSLMVAT